MIGSQDKQILVDRLEKAVDLARCEHYRMHKYKLTSASALWEGVRIGLQDAIRVIQGDDIPEYLRGKL
jgi:hypothetical protein